MFLENLINKLNLELVTNKTNFEDEKIINILKEYNQNDWEKYIIIDEIHYKKIKIFNNDIFDIFIIIWNYNQGTKIHDHAFNGCYLKVLKGSIEEQIYDNNLKPIKNNVLQINDIGFMKNDIGYHTIKNKHNDVAVSLHVYNPSGYKTNYF